MSRPHRHSDDLLASLPTWIVLQGRHPADDPLVIPEGQRVQLSSRRANDFLAYLQEREEREASAELLSIGGSEASFWRACVQADRGDVLHFEAARRNA